MSAPSFAQPDDFDQYRPRGECATGCGHPATEVWQLYKGQQRYDFRCRCCVAKGKLDRAIAYRDRIPALEADYAKEKESCTDAPNVATAVTASQ